MSTSLRLGLGVAAIAMGSLAWACSMSAEALAGKRGGESQEPGDRSPNVGGTSSGGPAAPGDLGPTDNAIIIVHAAKVQAFRLCFDGPKARELEPLPNAESMPQANVVGTDVGNAVRVPPLPPGRPGKVYLFEEALIRGIYFTPTSTTPCNDLIASPALFPLAINVGTIEDDLSKGVHLLVVKGCPKNGSVTYSVAECGVGWTPDKGNLAVEKISLPGAYRNDPKKLPTQVVNLSPALESARAGRALSVGFGKLDTQGKLTSVAENPALFGAPGAPVAVDFDPENLATYDESGFRVQVAAGGTAPAITIDASLAEIQKLSSPLDVPTSYYSVASNYVLLLLGNPNAKLEDGSPDTDPRNALHILAVPVVENTDGGAPDASADAP